MLRAIIHWTWCLPQALLGRFLVWKYRNAIIESRPYGRCALHVLDEIAGFGGLSIGQHLFVKKRPIMEITAKHEYGHYLQSLRLGPLFLLIIGTWSITLNLLARRSDRVFRKYNTYFPERWAERLGQVTAEERAKANAWKEKHILAKRH